GGARWFRFRLRHVVERFDELPDAFEGKTRAGDLLERVLQPGTDAAGERAAPLQRVLDGGEAIRGLAAKTANRGEQALLLDVRLHAAEPEIEQRHVALARIQRGVDDAELPADFGIRETDVFRGDLLVRLVGEPALRRDVGDDDVEDTVDLAEDELSV